ncbi:MAG: hypothetical protein ABI423_14265 [Burkholderiales bacterium]
MVRTLMLAACALLLAAAPDAALAQPKPDEAKERARINELRTKVRSYRCVTQTGRKYYGSTIPPQCHGELVEALSQQGLVLFRIEPPLTPEQRAAKEAEEEKAAAAEAARQEAQKATVRQRALASNREAAAQVEARIAQLRNRQGHLEKEMAKHKDPSEAPEKLRQDTKALAYDLSLQEQLLSSRKNEAAEINARYDEEKRKYHLLSGGAKSK